MPVLQRALKQRDTETKMFAAQIIGNMSSLTNQKDLEPYLPQILPGLKQVKGCECFHACSLLGHVAMPQGDPI
jgi:hypothetical protein